MNDGKYGPLVRLAHYGSLTRRGDKIPLLEMSGHTRHKSCTYCIWNICRHKHSVSITSKSRPIFFHNSVMKFQPRKYPNG